MQNLNYIVTELTTHIETGLKDYISTGNDYDPDMAISLFTEKLSLIDLTATSWQTVATQILRSFEQLLKSVAANPQALDEDEFTRYVKAIQRVYQLQDQIIGSQTRFFKKLKRAQEKQPARQANTTLFSLASTFSSFSSADFSQIDLSPYLADYALFVQHPQYLKIFSVSEQLTILTSVLTKCILDEKDLARLLGYVLNSELRYSVNVEDEKDSTELFDDVFNTESKHSVNAEFVEKLIEQPLKNAAIVAKIKTVLDESKVSTKALAKIIAQSKADNHYSVSGLSIEKRIGLTRSFLLDRSDFNLAQFFKIFAQAKPEQLQAFFQDPHFIKNLIDTPIEVDVSEDLNGIAVKLEARDDDRLDIIHGEDFKVFMYWLARQSLKQEADREQLLAFLSQILPQISPAVQFALYRKFHKSSSVVALLYKFNYPQGQLSSAEEQRQRLENDFAKLVKRVFDERTTSKAKSLYYATLLEQLYQEGDIETYFNIVKQDLPLAMQLKLITQWLSQKTSSSKTNVVEMAHYLIPSLIKSKDPQIAASLQQLVMELPFTEQLWTIFDALVPEQRLIVLLNRKDLLDAINAGRLNDLIDRLIAKKQDPQIVASLQQLAMKLPLTTKQLWTIFDALVPEQQLMVLLNRKGLLDAINAGRLNNLIDRLIAKKQDPQIAASLQQLAMQIPFTEQLWKILDALASEQCLIVLLTRTDLLDAINGGKLKARKCFDDVLDRLDLYTLVNLLQNELNSSFSDTLIDLLQNKTKGSFLSLLTNPQSYVSQKILARLAEQKINFILNFLIKVNPQNLKSFKTLFDKIIFPAVKKQPNYIEHLNLLLAKTPSFRWLFSQLNKNDLLKKDVASLVDHIINQLDGLPDVALLAELLAQVKTDADSINKLFQYIKSKTQLNPSQESNLHVALLWDLAVEKLVNRNALPMWFGSNDWRTLVKIANGYGQNSPQALTLLKAIKACMREADIIIGLQEPVLQPEVSQVLFSCLTKEQVIKIIKDEKLALETRQRIAVQVFVNGVALKDLKPKSMPKQSSSSGLLSFLASTSRDVFSDEEQRLELDTDLLDSMRRLPKAVLWHCLKACTHHAEQRVIKRLIDLVINDKANIMQHLLTIENNQCNYEYYGSNILLTLIEDFDFNKYPRLLSVLQKILSSDLRTDMERCRMVIDGMSEHTLVDCITTMEAREINRTLLGIILAKLNVAEHLAESKTLLPVIASYLNSMANQLAKVDISGLTRQLTKTDVRILVQTYGLNENVCQMLIKDWPFADLYQLLVNLAETQSIKAIKESLVFKLACSKYDKQEYKALRHNLGEEHQFALAKLDFVFESVIAKQVSVTTTAPTLRF